MINYDTKLYFNQPTFQHGSYLLIIKRPLPEDKLRYRSTYYKGKHTVELVFKQTLTQKISNALSLSGVIVLLLGIIKKRESKKV
jgi:hypothetical protein